MPQHKGTCASRYWRKVQQLAGSNDTLGVPPNQSRLRGPHDPTEEHSSHSQDDELLEAREKSCTLRFVHEHTVDVKLAADALSSELLRLEETQDVKAYKAALVTAFRLNIPVIGLSRRPSHLRFDRFDSLNNLAVGIDQFIRGKIGINESGVDEELFDQACFAGVAELLEPLYWRGASLDDAAYAAVQSGDLDTLRFALALGAEPESDALFDAWSYGRQDLVALLVESGADINHEYSYGNGCTLLGRAAQGGSLEDVRFVLSLGADPKISHPISITMQYCEENCMSPSRECGHEDVACLLIEKDADISEQCYGGFTVLHYAACRGHVRVLRAVLDRITSPSILDARDDDGNAVLHLAVGMEDLVPQHMILEVISMLLEAGADINARNSFGRSALMLATSDGNDEIARLLLDAGAIAAYKDILGQDALWLAARHGHATVVRHLMEKAPPTYKELFDLTHTLKYEAKENTEEVVELLVAFGATLLPGM